MQSSLRSLIEEDLYNDVRHFSGSSELPEKYLSQPGAFLSLVVDGWKRDGRSSHLSDARVAELMSEMIGCPISRGQLWYSLGNRTGGAATKHRQSEIPKEIAIAYLTIAFSHWTRTADGVFTPFVPQYGFDYVVVVRNAVTAMYRHGPVHCMKVDEGGLLPRDLTEILSILLKSQVSPITEKDLKRVLELARTSSCKKLTPEVVRWYLDPS